MGRVASARHDPRRRDGDLIGARGGHAGGVASAEIVHYDSVGPIGLHGNVVVVHSLVAGDWPVAAGVHGGNLVIIEPVLLNIVVVDVERT